MAHIQLKNITKKFGTHTALKGLDLEIVPGDERALRRDLLVERIQP